MERNSQVLELILKRKTTAFDNGIDVGGERERRIRSDTAILA
jgi:hypothetical protein